MQEHIKNRLKEILRKKFKNYTPEADYKPFHTRLLGKDRMALFSFIHSLNTNFGTTIFEPVAEMLAQSQFDEVERQKKLGNKISKDAQNEIQNIMDALLTGNKNPNKKEELKQVLKYIKSGEITQTKATQIDLFLRKGNNVYFIDLKSPKPNTGEVKGFKRTLLTWAAIYAAENPKANIHTLIAMPYNPYYPKDYERWTFKGLLDLKEELKVAEEFWDFVGGAGSYQMLLKIFEDVGQEMRQEIDDYFANFKNPR